MPRSRESKSEEEQRGQSFTWTSPPSRRNRAGAPLVIVSEQGRHSDESRRIVRAQAARASAAQSRVTRAKNREEREASSRESPISSHSPQSGGEMQWTPQFSTPPAAAAAAPPPPPRAPSSSRSGEDVESTSTVHPLGNWLRLLPPAQPTPSSRSNFNLNPVQPPTGNSNDSRLQLPFAVPRGFSSLQQRIQISDSVIGMLSRASCFDFSSPGAEDRLQRLLFDLIVGYSMADMTQTSMPGHPIQGFIRVACTSLTIFQSQRVNGDLQPLGGKYQGGLDAAWSEAISLDQNALMEPKSAEVSLWALFVISVTAGPSATFFYQVLNGLVEDLGCRVWEHVRNILKEFIYPSSYLDAPCRDFFHRFRGMQIASIG